MKAPPTKPAKAEQTVKQESPRPEPPGQEPYTFRVQCFFKIQYTVTESEVGPDTDGFETDVMPTDDAINALEQQFREWIEAKRTVTSFQAYAESDELLDVSGEADDELYTFLVLCDFEVQHTFTASEVEPDPGGVSGGFCPTAAALKLLEQELKEQIGNHHCVDSFEICDTSAVTMG